MFDMQETYGRSSSSWAVMPSGMWKCTVISANRTAAFVTRLFIMSQDFMKLCNVTDIDAMYFYKVSFGKINRLVHKHFSDSCLV